MARSIRPGASSGGMLRMLERTGIRKGLSGNKAWFYVGTGLWTVRTVRRMAGPKEQLLISETLAPGERIVIRNDPAPPTGRKARKQAKKAKKAAKRSKPTAAGES